MHLPWLSALALCVATTSAAGLHSPRSLPDNNDMQHTARIERQAVRACGEGNILYAGKCVYPSRCPVGTFPNLETQRCQICNTRFTGAQTCTAATVTECKSPRYLRLGRCVDQCPVGTYNRPGTRNCLGCTGLFSFSTACTPTRATACRAPRVLVNGACTEASTCAAGSFLNTATNACVKCPDTNALTCNSTVSLTCKANFSVISGRCLAGCASAEYLDGSTCKLCSSLFPSSLTCTKAAATSCGGTTSLKNGTCVSPCPAKTYANASNVCTACSDANALTCNSTGALSCDTTFLRANATCGACPTGFRDEASNRQCIACATNAATCTSSAISTCLPGFSLTGGACVATSSCASNQYRDSTRNVCVSCAELGPSILTCTEAAGATSCVAGNTPLNGQCGCAANEYLSTPPSRLRLSKRVPSTPPSCRSCAAQYNADTLTCTQQDALTCTVGFVTIDGTACEVIKTCTTTEYLDTTSNKCVACTTTFGPNVATCTAAGATGCGDGVMIDGNGECACAPDKYLTSPPTRFGKRQGFVPTCEPCSVKYNSQTTACTETEAKACEDTYITIGGKACEKEASCSSAEYVDPSTNKCVACLSTFGEYVEQCTSDGPVDCTLGFSVAARACKSVCGIYEYYGNTHSKPEMKCRSCSEGYNGLTLTCDANGARSCKPPQDGEEYGLVILLGERVCQIVQYFSLYKRHTAQPKYQPTGPAVYALANTVDVGSLDECIIQEFNYPKQVFDYGGYTDLSGYAGSSCGLTRSYDENIAPTVSTLTFTITRAYDESNYQMSQFWLFIKSPCSSDPSKALRKAAQYCDPPSPTTFPPFPQCFPRALDDDACQDVYITRAGDSHCYVTSTGLPCF